VEVNIKNIRDLRSKADYGENKEQEKTVQELYEETRKQKLGYNVFGEKLDRFTPLKQETIQQGEVCHGVFLERVESECEDCPEQYRMFDTFHRDNPALEWHFTADERGENCWTGGRAQSHTRAKVTI
jgi:hypothetical protein